MTFAPTKAGAFTGIYQITGNDGAGGTPVTVRGVALDRPGSPLLGPGSKCLDVRGAGTADGTPVQIYTCNGTGAQSWTSQADRTLRALNKCLDVSGGGTVNGTRVQLWTCNGTGAQIWAVQDDGSLRNPQSDRCLDVPGGNTADGSALQIYDCNQTPAQRWQPTNGILPLKPLGEVIGLADKCLDVHDRARVPTGPSSSCTRATTRWPSGGPCSATTTSRSFGKCLDVVRRRDGQREPRADLDLQRYRGADLVRRWSSGGLLNPQSGRCLDVPAANPTNGTALQLYDCNGTGAQKWNLPS